MRVATMLSGWSQVTLDSGFLDLEVGISSGILTKKCHVCVCK